MSMLGFWMYRILIDSKKKAKKDLKKEDKKELHFLAVVMKMNFIFFLFYLPFSVTFILVVIFNYFVSSSETLHVQINLAHKIAMCCSYIYNCIPFFINYKFNTLFRTEVYKILKIKSRGVAAAGSTNTQTQNNTLPYRKGKTGVATTVNNTMH